MRRFAEGTSVPVNTTKAEIDRLLCDWGCTHIQWIDDREHGIVTMRFVWKRDGQAFLARFNLQLQTEAQMREQAIDGRSGNKPRVSETKLTKLRRLRGCQEHRLLLLKLKADLNAVEAGLIKAETVFLPWLEGSDGVTVEEAIVPQLSKLLVGSADRLLPGHREER